MSDWTALEKEVCYKRQLLEFLHSFHLSIYGYPWFNHSIVIIKVLKKIGKCLISDWMLIHQTYIITLSPAIGHKYKSKDFSLRGSKQASYGEYIIPPHKMQMVRAVDDFFAVCGSNRRITGYLRRHDAHYDVALMLFHATNELLWNLLGRK